MTNNHMYLRKQTVAEIYHGLANVIHVTLLNKRTSPCNKFYLNIKK